jgi:hypothetical protein
MPAGRKAVVMHALDEGSNFWRKMIPTVGTVVALGAVAVMALINGVPLSKAVLTALSDPNPINLGLVLNGLAIGLSVTIGIFVVSRWSSFTDEISSMKDGLKQMLTLLAEKAGVQIVLDDASLWAGMVVRMVSENAGLLSECVIQTVAGGRYRISVDEVRIGNFVERLIQPMQLIYIFYVPRNVVGENPAVSLLRLTHIVRVSRSRAVAKGNDLKATVRVIIVDSPRPGGAIFIGSQMVNGKVKPFGREYYRDINTTVRSNTPTADRMLLEHQDAKGIEALEALVKKSASNGVEVEFEEMERLFGELLPEHDGGTAPIITAAIWNRVVKALYRGAQAASFESVVLSDGHFVFNEIRPSLGDERRRGSSVAKPPPPSDTATDADDVATQ